jgi:hypothetical protein
MLSRLRAFISAFAVPSGHAHAQQAIVAAIKPHFAELGRAEILRGIRGAEDEVTRDLEPTIADARFLTGNEKDMAAYYKRAAFCYRALTLLIEKTDFPNIAAIYRARAELYDDILQGKISTAQFETREKENETAKLRTVTAELTALDKEASPHEGTQQSLEQLGYAIGQVILAAVHKQQGDVPYVHTFNQGMIALSEDNHARAAKLLRPLAERGDPRAQFWTGHFYSEGKGGYSQNFAEALKWFQRAADQQESGGQYFLGSMYFEGQGVSRDLVTSYMWFSLAAAQGDDKAAKARDGIAEQMTPAQIAEAKQRASEWKPAAR